MLLNPPFTKGFHWPGYCQTDQAKGRRPLNTGMHWLGSSAPPPPPLHPLAVQLDPLPTAALLKGLGTAGLLSGRFPPSSL